MNFTNKDILNQALRLVNNYFKLFFFFGRPPKSPFLRAISAFFSLLTDPPILPISCMAFSNVVRFIGSLSILSNRLGILDQHGE